MKIALVWAHGTGKTTVLNEMVKMWFDQEKTITEVARKVFATLWKTPDNMNTEELIDAQKMIYAMQLIEESERNEFVSDRGIYDNVAYMSFVSDYYYKRLMSAVKNLHSWYDHTYKTNIEFPLVNDGVRFTNVAFQKAVDERIFDILEFLQVPYTILSGTPKERAKIVMSHF